MYVKISSTYTQLNMITAMHRINSERRLDLSKLILNVPYNAPRTARPDRLPNQLVYMGLMKTLKGFMSFSCAYL